MGFEDENWINVIYIDSTRWADSVLTENQIAGKLGRLNDEIQNHICRLNPETRARPILVVERACPNRAFDADNARCLRRNDATTHICAMMSPYLPIDKVSYS